MWNTKDKSSSGERAQEIARKALAGEYDLLLACRDLADLKGQLTDTVHETMLTFVGVASETDDLPIGIERENWAIEALDLKDAEAADYRERVREIVEQALKKLLLLLHADAKDVSNSCRRDY